jgi:hypothetical protein
MLKKITHFAGKQKVLYLLNLWGSSPPAGPETKRLLNRPYVGFGPSLNI